MALGFQYGLLVLSVVENKPLPMIAEEPGLNIGDSGAFARVPLLESAERLW